ncbi:MAG TPA: hypothetical protein VE222_10790 [Nitrospiraceae bacterium]|jgi:hypothetical protein|nr:hypothetical protein [Nitrospiraceae bacterium]
MKNVGNKRRTIARIGAAMGFVCGTLGLLAGLTDHTWKLGMSGWFEGGILVTLIALFLLLDGMFAFQKDRTAG